MALRFNKLINLPPAIWLRLLFAFATLNVSIGGAILLDANPVCFSVDGVHAVEQHLVPVQLFTIFQLQSLTEQPPPVKHLPVSGFPGQAVVQVQSSAAFADAAVLELTQILHLLEYTIWEQPSFVDSQFLELTFPPKALLLLNPYLSVPQKPPTF